MIILKLGTCRELNRKRKRETKKVASSHDEISTATNTKC